MAGLDAMPIFPFEPGGAAHGTALPSGAVALTDLTASPRFGLKGGGSAAWLTAHGVALPAINRIGSHRGMRVLRLGNEDILLLGRRCRRGAGRTPERLGKRQRAERLFILA